jgi:hypothetical protein
MAELYFYSVMTAVPSGTIRFGWVSATTGITYCGICLRSPVAPQVGEECKACGARVAQLLDIRAKGDAWRDLESRRLNAAELRSPAGYAMCSS